MVVVQAAIPLAMKTSIGPELSELTQRQAITTGKRLSKSLNHYRADVKSVQTNASLKAIYSHYETKPNSPREFGLTVNTHSCQCPICFIR
jgi:hypothetical protein